MARTTLQAGALIEHDPTRFIKRKAVRKMTNDITKLPTSEILHRLYKRHSVGVWEFIFCVTFIALIVSNI